MNAHEIKFRCSALSNLMTEPRSKSEKLSETTKTHLLDVFVSEVYGRKEQVKGKQLDKGNDREESSITLLSRFTKKFYTKNEDQMSNEFIKGTPDLFDGAEHIIDIKTSWSMNTFMKSKMSALDKAYYWQLQGYMALTGAKRATVAFCLVNGTPEAIMNEQRVASYRYGVDPDTSVEFRDECKQIEINHIFDFAEFESEAPYYSLYNDREDLIRLSVPMAMRVHQFHFERNDEDITRLYERIKQCREYMDEYLFANKKPLTV